MRATLKCGWMDFKMVLFKSHLELRHLRIIVDLNKILKIGFNVNVLTVFYRGLTKQFLFELNGINGE